MLLARQYCKHSTALQSTDVTHGMQVLVPSKELAQKHYAEHDGKPFFPKLVDFLSSGAVVATVWEGKEVVKFGRTMIGATNPLASSPGTIRLVCTLPPLHNATTAQCKHCTMPPLHNATTAQCNHCTTDHAAAIRLVCTLPPLHTATTAQCHHCTLQPLHKATTAQCNHCTTDYAAAIRRLQTTAVKMLYCCATGTSSAVMQGFCLVACV